ncbi:hypothetical protein Vadar_006805 [Vaccinium darrowii]|uniref:Uncharacterized protein n=1 Tax=Vaccinium darrowii TaxID=229202 RepID=A0ACB7XNQ8_9ERIC|nr:hypothetical protein Vadar_006805 [Vaccinium darrowii]
MDVVLYDATKRMDSNLYKAVKDGNVQYLDDQHLDLSDTHLTPYHNTILHVAAHFGMSECVAKILEKKPNLICQVNLKDENPLHIAAREKKFDVVEALIKRAKELDDQDPESGGKTRQELLRAINVDGDTALHLAVREEDDKIVKLLVEEDPDFKHPLNKAEETPLYLAAERRYGDSMVKSILASKILPGCTGPSGRTALHAAAIFGNTAIIKMLLERYENLIDEPDTEGWTPLHYAARRYNSNIAGKLLEKNKSIGYTCTSQKHDESTALHIAAARDNEEVIEEILDHCPDCWEMVNNKGRNILHIAVDTEAREVIKYIVNKGWLESLMNQKDFEGNTPLHLVASSETLNLKYKDDIINHPRANMYAFNNQNSSPAEVASSVGKGIRSWLWKPRGGRNIAKREEDDQGNIHKEQLKRSKEREEKMRVKKAEALKKTSKSLTLVATLIATITFAAAFAVPGGYEVNRGSEEGMAVLVREASFKAFVVANTIAVMSSTSSVIFYVFAAFYYFDEVDQGQRYKWGFYLVLIAIVAMTGSFISGSYAMMAHSLSLVITTSTIGSITFLIYFFEVQRLFKLWYRKLFPWQHSEEMQD